MAEKLFVWLRKTEERTVFQAESSQNLSRILPIKQYEGMLVIVLAQPGRQYVPSFVFMFACGLLIQLLATQKLFASAELPAKRCFANQRGTGVSC